MEIRERLRNDRWLPPGTIPSHIVGETHDHHPDPAATPDPDRRSPGIREKGGEEVMKAGMFP